MPFSPISPANRTSVSNTIQRTLTQKTEDALISLDRQINTINETIRAIEETTFFKKLDQDGIQLFYDYFDQLKQAVIEAQDSTTLDITNLVESVCELRDFAVNLESSARTVSSPLSQISPVNRTSVSNTIQRTLTQKTDDAVISLDRQINTINKTIRAIEETIFFKQLNHDGVQLFCDYFDELKQAVIEAQDSTTLDITHLVESVCELRNFAVNLESSARTVSSPLNLNLPFNPGDILKNIALLGDDYSLKLHYPDVVTINKTFDTIFKSQKFLDIKGKYPQIESQVAVFKKALIDEIQNKDDKHKLRVKHVMGISKELDAVFSAPNDAEALTQLSVFHKCVNNSQLYPRTKAAAARILVPLIMLCFAAVLIASMFMFGPLITGLTVVLGGVPFAWLVAQCDLKLNRNDDVIQTQEEGRKVKNTLYSFFQEAKFTAEQDSKNCENSLLLIPMS